jgi:heme/copper-type cytochrome/quinol oxidase subunit 1
MSYFSAAFSHRRMSDAILSAAHWLYCFGESVPRRYATAFRQMSACRRRSDFDADFGIDSSVAAWHDARYAATIFQCIASFSIAFWSVVVQLSTLGGLIRDQ